MVETSSPSRWGCRSSGRRQRSEAGARIPRVEGRCRNVARAITTHRFGLWAVLEAGWITAHPEVHRARSASHGPEDLLNRPCALAHRLVEIRGPPIRRSRLSSPVVYHLGIRLELRRNCFRHFKGDLK